MYIYMPSTVCFECSTLQDCIYTNSRVGTLLLFITLVNYLVDQGNKYYPSLNEY